MKSRIKRLCTQRGYKIEFVKDSKGIEIVKIYSGKSVMTFDDLKECERWLKKWKEKWLI